MQVVAWGKMGIDIRKLFLKNYRYQKWLAL